MGLAAGQKVTVRILVGAALDRLRSLPDNSVHCCVTSPPYWGLRSYQGDEGMIGVEPTFDAHLESLLSVFREVRRVLRDDGTLWLNYGDAYAGSGVRTAEHANPGISQTVSRNGAVPVVDYGRFKPKDLMMMPARVAMALQEDGWWLRSEIVWHKPNPMPESVTDRPTASHEKIFLLAKSPRYFYDSDAVRIPGSPNTHARRKDGTRKAAKGTDPNDNRDSWVDTRSMEQQALLGSNLRNVWDYDDPETERTPKDLDGRSARMGRSPGWHQEKQRGHERRHQGFDERWDQMPKAEQQAMGSNLRNVWRIPVFPFRGAHFATFPPALAETCIKAGTSEKGVCRACGTPWQRQVEVPERSGKSWHAHGDDLGSGQSQPKDLLPNVARHTTGWEIACDCEDAQPAAVLDPFAGSGTVGLVADRLHRDAVLIEISADYARMARDRIKNDNSLYAAVSLEDADG